MSQKERVLLELRRASSIISRIGTGQVKLDDVVVSAMLATDAVDTAIDLVEQLPDSGADSGRVLGRADETSQPA